MFLAKEVRDTVRYFGRNWEEICRPEKRRGSAALRKGLRSWAGKDGAAGCWGEPFDGEYCCWMRL
jgi:hypothetical protein